MTLNISEFLFLLLIKYNLTIPMTIKTPQLYFIWFRFLIRLSDNNFALLNNPLSEILVFFWTIFYIFFYLINILKFWSVLFMSILKNIAALEYIWIFLLLKCIFFYLLIILILNVLIIQIKIIYFFIIYYLFLCTFIRLIWHIFFIL